MDLQSIKGEGFVVGMYDVRYKCRDVLSLRLLITPVQGQMFLGINGKCEIIFIRLEMDEVDEERYPDIPKCGNA